MLKLCMLVIAVVAAKCQDAPAAPLQPHSDHHRLADPYWRDHRYYNPRGIPPRVYGDETPKPYSFSYDAVNEVGVGSSSRREVADASGRVEGSYTVTNDEGHSREVQYVADEAGFRANIRTNEPGTDNQNPADVVIESSAPTTYGSHIAYRPGLPIRGERPVEVAKDVVAEKPDSPAAPPRPTPLPYYHRAPHYTGHHYPRYGHPYSPYY